MESSSQSSADAPAQPVPRPRRIVTAAAFKAMAEQDDGTTTTAATPAKRTRILTREEFVAKAKPTTGRTGRDIVEGRAELTSEETSLLAGAQDKSAAAFDRLAKQGTPDQARRLQTGARRLRESATKHRVAAAQDRRSVPRVESGLGASRERRATPTRSRGSRRGTAARSSSSDPDLADPPPPADLGGRSTCPSNRAVAP